MAKRKQRQIAELERRHRMGYRKHPMGVEEFKFGAGVSQRVKAGSYEESILKKIVAILRSALNSDRIILFGSRAKGTFHPGSDFDIAIDRKSPEDRMKRRIMDAIDEVRGLHSVDVIYLRDGDPKFREIVLETGKIIYEKRNKKSLIRTR